MPSPDPTTTVRIPVAIHTKLKTAVKRTPKRKQREFLTTAIERYLAEVAPDLIAS